MRVVWTLGGATAKQIVESLGETFHWSSSTVKTFLARLFDKEIISREKSGREFVYHATKTESETVDLLTSDLANKVCAKKHMQVIKSLIASSDFTSQDLQELSQALAVKKAVAEVKCDCLEGGC